MRWLRPEMASCAASSCSTGPGLPGDGGHLRRGQQGAEEEERAPQLFVGADFEDPEGLLLLRRPVSAVASSIRVFPIPASPSRTTARRPVAGCRQSCLGDHFQLLGPAHHRALRSGGAGVEGGGGGGPGLSGDPLGVALVPPQDLEQPPSVGKAFEPEQAPVDDPGVAERPGQVLDHLGDQDLAALGLVGDPGCGVDRGAVGVAGGLGDIAGVETHPHREGHVGVGLVVLLDRPLDRDCGPDRLVGRGEQGHEPVSEGFGLHRTGDLQSGADQVVVEADDLIGDGVTDPDPEVGGAFQIREKDREGAL